MKIKFTDKLIFLLGLFSTITILQLRLGSFSITFFNVTLYAIVFIEFINMMKNNWKISLNKNFTIFVFIIFLSTLINVMGDIENDWKVTSIKIAINFICFYLPFYFLLGKQKINDKKILFFKGLYISSCMQLIWEFLQIIFWYKFGLSLNDVFFNGVLGVPAGKGWSWDQYDIMGTFRFTGLGWQASNLALSLIIGYILSPNLLFKVMFVIGILLSTSRVGIVVLVLCILIDCFVYKRFNNIFKQLKKVNLINSLVVIFLTLVIFIAILKEVGNNLNIMNSISNTFNKTVERLNESGTDIHMLYYLYIPEIFSKSSLIRILLGYGMGCAGYPFSVYYNFYSSIGPWIPETDFISTLLNVGIVGFIFYYKWYLTEMLKKIKCRIDFIILICILFAGIFYAYMNSWVLIVIMFCMVGRGFKVEDLFLKKKKFKDNNIDK